MDKQSLKEFFTGKKVLITGHTGFKGGWLTQMLLELGAHIIGYSLKPNTVPNLFSILNLKDKIKNYFGDIAEYEKLFKVMMDEKPDIVFHLAAQPLVRDSYDDPLYTYRTNILGTANVLQAIKNTSSVRAAVMITTDKVYENKEWIWPYREVDVIGSNPDPYSTSKACAELVIQSYLKSFFNIENYNKTHSCLIASARAGNVIGGGDWANDRLVSDIIKNIFEKNKNIIIRSPESIRPWQHVLEPLVGYLMLSKELYQGNKNFVGAWNFAPDENNHLTVKELIEKSINILGKGSYSIKMDNKKHEAKLLKLDSTKSKTYLHWRPVLNMDETLTWTFEWYKNYYSNKNMLNFTKKQIETFLAR